MAGDCCCLPSQKEMAALDQSTIQGGVPSLELMERAGAAVFRAIAAELPCRTVGRQVCILCGPGNNGGDGLVVARHLLENGIPHCVVAASAARYSGDFAAEAARFCAAGGVLHFFPEAGQAPAGAAIAEESLTAALTASACVVDALLGTGQQSAPRAAVRQLLDAALRAGREAVWAAIDIPTGSNGDTGEVYEPCVTAALTVAIQLIKRGMLQYPARAHCGKIVVVPIGIACPEGGAEYQLLRADDLPRVMRRAPAAHKGTFGHVVVAAGSRDMPGSALLAARAALRGGAGLVTKLQPAALPRGMEAPELMFRLVEDGGEGIFREEAVPAALEALARADAAVIGPGLGRSPATAEFLRRVFEHTACPAVLDADALNVIVDAGLTPPAHAVLTPHPGEAARLLSRSTAEVQRDRYGTARALSEKFGAVAVLKGAASIVHDGDRGWVNESANPFLATAGSGDVLSGIIGALLAQGLSPLEAAKTGVYLHSRCGAIASHQSGGLIAAGDLISAEPRAFAELA